MSKPPVPYKLKHPVDLKGAEGATIETIRELQLRRLSGASAALVLDAQAKGAGSFMRTLVCQSAQIPPSTFDQLDAEDAMAAMEIASGFFGIALPTSSR